MATWNLGSASDMVYSMIANVPSSVSGAVLLNIIDQERIFMENYTGQSIGSTAIAERYQPALVDLSCADLSNTISMNGGVINSTTIGELSVSKNVSSAESMTSGYRESGMMKLKALMKSVGGNIVFKKVWGS